MVDWGYFIDSSGAGEPHIGATILTRPGLCDLVVVGLDMTFCVDATTV